tara:strand:- start:474 stop:1343 length:870 start_codon:yes stop_codon:yes gene_type:complete
MTTGLLGDTPFLDLLQDYTVKFNNRVESNPFGNYSNFQASDFVNTPFGERIAQPKFDGNQFLMPDLSGSTYTPGNFSLAPGAGFNFGNMGTYTPGAFNQFFQAPMTSPAMARPASTTRDRDGRENLERFLRGGSAPLGAVGTQFVGDQGFRINADGTVTKLDEDSLDYKFNKFMSGLLSATPGNLIRNAIAGTPQNISDLAQQVGNQFGDEAAANFFAEAAKNRPSGALTSEQADAARRRAFQSGTTTGPTRDRAGNVTDPGGLNRQREKEKDRLSRETGKSRGFFGGR